MKQDNETAQMEVTDITPADEPGVSPIPGAPEVEQPAGPDAAPSIQTDSESEEVVYTAEQIGEMMAEAEERGYIRGRNERITALMMRPGLLENPLRPRESATRQSGSDLAEAFLSSLRPNVWD